MQEAASLRAFTERPAGKAAGSLTARCTGPASSSDGRLLSVFAGRGLHLLLGCSHVKDTVTGRRACARSPLGLLLLLELLLRLSSLHLQQPELHSELNDGLPLLVNCLVQVIVLYLKERWKGQLARKPGQKDKDAGQGTGCKPS